jgi:hypothetical protein
MMIRYLSRDQIAYFVEGQGGLVIPSAQKSRIPPEARIIPNPGRKMAHVGEAHITVSMGPELTKALGPNPTQTLMETGFFEPNGKGMRCTIQYTHKLRVLQAAFYKDEADPKGPILIAEEVRCPAMAHIREKLGMPALPTMPDGQPYIPHVTYGYIAAKNIIHQTYVQKFGSQPRRRQSLLGGEVGPTDDQTS